MTSRIITALVAVAILLPAGSDAQVGGLIKRGVKKAVSEAAGEKAGVRTSTTELPAAIVGGEITSDTLDRVLAGLQAMVAQRGRVEEVQRRLSDAQAKQSAFLDANMPALERYEKNRQSVEQCRIGVFRDLDEKRAPDIERLVEEMRRSPEKAKEISDLMARSQAALNEALARGDTVTANRVAREYQQKVLGIDPVADSAAANQKCGKVPPAPAIVGERKRLDALTDSARNEVRDAEEAVQRAGPAASKLPEARFWLARERLVTWLAAERNGSAGSSFPDGEHKLFTSRKDEIKRLVEAS